MMLSLAGKKLGVGLQVFKGNLDNETELKEFCAQCDRITYENEHLPTGALKRTLLSEDQLFPKLPILEIVRDRIQQKEFLHQLGLPLAPFVTVLSERELMAKAMSLGLPGIFKTSRLGYDGKGQLRVDRPSDLPRVWKILGEVPLVYEKQVFFQRELSLIACRNAQGQTVFYPLGENTHCGGILNHTQVPAPRWELRLQALAETYAENIFRAWAYEGVLALELFQVGDELLINEIASRVHNTGHWTLEAAETSQFENHLRAGLGFPLGNSRALGFSAMFNLIGELPDVRAIQEKLPGAAIHLYGKEARPGRKLGHLTLMAPSELLLEKQKQLLQPLLR